MRILKKLTSLFAWSRPVRRLTRPKRAATRVAPAPGRSILDRSFAYDNSASTDLEKKFRELRERPLIETNVSDLKPRKGSR